MEEKPKLIIDDDDIEILDFDDDIIDESPEVLEIIEEDVEPEIIEIIDIEEPVKVEEVPQQIIEPVTELKQPEEEKIVPNGHVENKIEQVSNTELVKQNINTESINEIKNNDDSNEIVSDAIFKDDKRDQKPSSYKNDVKIVKKGKIKWKSVFIGILIFIALFGVIIALPFISSYVNNIEKQTYSSPTINVPDNENFKSNINVKKALEGIKDYSNYQYQNINTISTKDNTEKLMSIKNNYVYSFNETKFEIYINKVVADFSYEIRDYYEKLDDVYHLYINDITTKTYNKKNTTEEEFNKLKSIFPNMINYLINNHTISEEKLLKIGKEEHTDITLKVPKDIVNNMSVETDRIQNKIDSNVLEQEFVNVDLLFDENNKLYRIEIEIEDKNASQETLDNSVESAILKYIFTDFNKTADITLPEL